MDVFLFPMVNVTLFPRTTKPLPVFEPRYIEMFKQASSQQVPVAIGFVDNPNQQGPAVPGQTLDYVRPIAGLGTSQIVEERLNGTILVFLHGIGKVQLKEVVDTDTPYIVCQAEMITENLQVDPALEPSIKVLNVILARWVQTHIPDADQREIFMRNLLGPEEIVGAFSSYLIKDYDFQQKILELNDINEKIKYLHRLAESSQLLF